MLDVQKDLTRFTPYESQMHKIHAEWGWGELRDYVASEITSRFGSFPRDSLKEASIFKRFIKDWGDQAQTIARYAFEVQGGVWDGAPITINRFCRNADPYFAIPIAERLADLR